MINKNISIIKNSSLVIMILSVLGAISSVSAGVWYYNNTKSCENMIMTDPKGELYNRMSGYLKKRGYNQSQLLSKALSSLLDIPYQDTLRKIKRTKKQHRLKYAERKTNLTGAFEVIDKELIKDKRILLIDDIVTSGYTLGNCAKKLSSAKPELICCATIASAQGKYPQSTVI